MDLAIPALDHAMPDEPERLARGEVPRWSLGGGTAMALRMGHRISDDIDIFLSGIPLRALTPSNNPAAKAIHPYPQWPGHYLKFQRPEGEVDFLGSALQTAPGFTLETFRGRAVAVETVDEVIVKKIRYRAAKFTPRDAFDLACAFDARPEVAVAIATEASDALPRLGVVLKALAANGSERMLAQVRPTPAYADILKDAASRAQEAIEAAKKMADKPLDATTRQRLREAVETVMSISPGTRRGSLSLRWEDGGQETQAAKLALINAHPIEANAMLVARWMTIDRASFELWETSGRAGRETGPISRG